MCLKDHGLDGQLAQPRQSDTPYLPQPAMGEQQAASNEVPQQPSNQAGQALTDDYLMHFYKVVPCKRKYAHDWASCPCGHKGERAARRDPQTHPYMAIACQYAKQRLPCPLGDRCPHAHNLFEYWLHPQRFKTELCQFGANCDRPVCFFGHAMPQLRPLDPSLPPAEACWSAGAALANRDNHFQRQQHTLLQQQQRMMNMQTAGMACYQGQRIVLQAPAGMTMMHQQPEQQLVFAPGGTQQYTQPQQQQQQMLLLQQQQQQQMLLVQQQGHSTGAAGFANLPMSSAGPSGMAAGGFTVMQVQASQLQASTPQMQMQHSAPGSNQPTYVWLQVPEAAASSSSGAYMPAHGVSGACNQQVQAGMPAQGVYVQSPHTSAGFMQQAGTLSNTGPAGVAMGLPGGLRGLPELQQQFALSSKGMDLRESTMPVVGFQTLSLQ